MKIIHIFLEFFLDFRHFWQPLPQNRNFANEAAHPKTCKMAHAAFGCAAVVPRAHRSASQRQRKEVRKHVFAWFLSHFSYILLYICWNGAKRPQSLVFRSYYTRLILCAAHARTFFDFTAFARADKCSQALGKFHKQFCANILYIRNICIFIHDLCRKAVQT